jgi:hypothetical protein
MLERSPFLGVLHRAEWQTMTAYLHAQRFAFFHSEPNQVQIFDQTLNQVHANMLYVTASRQLAAPLFTCFNFDVCVPFECLRHVEEGCITDIPGDFVSIFRIEVCDFLMINQLCSDKFLPPVN